MSPQFHLYRILCCTPPELEDQRCVFETAVGLFNEEVAMPEGVLYAAASMPPFIHAVRRRHDIDTNIRMSKFVVHMFGETWPDAVFEHFLEQALERVADPDAATSKVAVLFRNFAGAAAEVRRLRESLAGGKCELREFQDDEELSSLLRELLQEWHAAVRNPIE